jgi:hypothetical protein
MNIHSELQRIWRLNAEAVKRVPIERVFTGKVPDKFIDKDGEEKELNAPYVVIWTPDTTAGEESTSMTVSKEVTVQISCFADTLAEATSTRDFLFLLFEDADLKIGGTHETFQDISYDTAGELDPVDGVWEAFQRFRIVTALSRPRRKKV